MACLRTKIEERQLRETSDPPAEEWRTIAKAPRYEVSSEGRVRRSQTGKVLSPSLDRHGYRFVTVAGSDGRKSLWIAPIVAEAFHSPRPLGQVVNHINRITTDNRRENLEWTTVLKNTPRGERKKSKLNSEAVKVIRHVLAKRPAIGLVPLLAKLHGVCRAAIQKVESGHSWRGVA